MLILIEGVDLAGKSTLAKRLYDVVTEREPEALVRTLHRGKPMASPLDDYELDIEEYIPGSGTHIICDRWHLGEGVYGPLLRMDSLLNPPSRWHIEAFLRSRGALLVMAETPDDDELRRRYDARGEDLLTFDELKVADFLFNHHLAKSFLPYIKAPITYDGLDALVEDIIKSAQLLESRAAAVSQFRTYIGPVHPRILLLGDRQNLSDAARKRHSYHVTAFTPWPDSSGYFLINAMDPLTARDIGIANMFELDVRKLVNVLGPEHLVSLGNAAHEMCVAYGMPEQLGSNYHKVPHPQYVRRFFNRRVAEYGKALRCELDLDPSEWRTSRKTTRTS